MKRRDLLLGAALLPIGAAAARAAVAPDLAWLIGKWRGEGQLMGAPGTADLVARLSLGDQFLEIDWRTLGVGEKRRYFEGRGFYRLAGDPLPGSWIDNTGAIKPLTARVNGQALHVDWGTADTQHGQSVYALGSDGVLTVNDSIAVATGLRRFATHSLRRVV